MPGSLKIDAGWSIVYAKAWPWSRKRFHLATLLPNGGTTIWWGLSKNTLEEWTEPEVFRHLNKDVARVLGMHYGVRGFVEPTWGYRTVENAPDLTTL